MSKPKEIEAVQSNALAHTDPATMVSIIERAARDESVDMDKLERLMAMHERIVAKQAEQSYTVSMAQAQAEMSPIAADATNPQTRSKFASYMALDRALRPIYTKHGFSLSFDTEDTDKADMVRVVCHVSHRDGHTRKHHADMPADGKGAKGGDVMTKTHATGSAMSYGMRYLLKLIFNVAVGEHDDDGNKAAQTQRITESQVADLQSLIDETNSDKAAFLKFAKVERLEDIHPNAFGPLVKKLEAKRKQGAA